MGRKMIILSPLATLFYPEDLIGKTVLMDKQEDGFQTRATS
jgi:hypothetical protein